MAKSQTKSRTHPSIHPVSRPILVDSCWYIHQARTGNDPLQLLAFLAESRDIATCGMIMSEVGRGVKLRTHLDRYHAAWSMMLFIESSRRRWQETAELAWSLDRRGITLPIQDIHIAVCAHHIGAVVLTHDKRFDSIPGIDATDRIF